MAKKISKEQNNNNEPLLLSKERTWMDMLKSESLLMHPGNSEWRKRFINTLLIWAEKETSLEIMQFCIEYKMGRRTIYEWAEKYKDIGQALHDAKLMIASHRRTGSMTKKLDGNYAYKDMHMYDSDWHAINKYHSDLKKEEEKQSHTFIINSEKPKVLSKEELKLMKEIVAREENGE